MNHTPGPWTWRRPFTDDPEIWIEGEKNGDPVLVAILENETDAKIICTVSKMYERLCDALYYVDSAAGKDPEAACLSQVIRALLSER